MLSILNFRLQDHLENGFSRKGFKQSREDNDGLGTLTLQDGRSMRNGSIFSPLGLETRSIK
jgi:hypothetical protein